MKADFFKMQLAGLYSIKLNKLSDDRGAFVKFYNADFFSRMNAHFVPEEMYLTVSKKNTLRGMHFQLPPSHHNKAVFCTKGAALDVAVSLRKDDYGQLDYLQLSPMPGDCQGVFLPAGLAHGFLALEDDTEMLYIQDSQYDPALDEGVLWSSIDFDWGMKDPLLSERDKLHSALKDFTKVADWD